MDELSVIDRWPHLWHMRLAFTFMYFLLPGYLLMASMIKLEMLLQERLTGLPGVLTVTLTSSLLMASTYSAVILLIDNFFRYSIGWFYLSLEGVFVVWVIGLFSGLSFSLFYPRRLIDI